MRTLTLEELRGFVLERIAAAERDGVIIDDGNVVDLIADQCDNSLGQIRTALFLADLSARFPRATASR
jgi:hypothetical protein